MRALQVYMVDMIATEYEAKCSALNVVVNAQADAQRSGSSVGIIGRTESTYRISAPATTTQSRLRTVIRQYQAMRVVLAVAVAPTSDHRPFYSRTPSR